jgi:hypothetical protein
VGVIFDPPAATRSMFAGIMWSGSSGRYVHLPWLRASMPTLAFGRVRSGGLAAHTRCGTTRRSPRSRRHRPRQTSQAPSPPGPAPPRRSTHPQRTLRGSRQLHSHRECHTNIRTDMTHGRMPEVWPSSPSPEAEERQPRPSARQLGDNRDTITQRGGPSAISSAVRARVAQACDRETCPIRAVSGPPRRTAFGNRGGAVGDVHLEADLVSGAFRNSAVGPPPDLIERVCGDHEGSSGSGRRILTLRGSTTTTQLRSSSSGWVFTSRWMR